jgi:AcrR family transcriptional regulator
MEDRSLDLLWAPRRRRRGPAPALTLKAIARAGIDLADADGLGAVSMRRVAAALGVAPMALYRYVPGKAELLDAMVDHALGDPPPPANGDWRAQVTAHAHATRELHRRHAWLGTIGRPPLGPNAVAAFDALLAALAGAGLPPADTVAAAELIGGYAAGAAAREEAAERNARFWAERPAFWERHYTPERFPALTALYEAGAYDDPPDAFEFGLARILDGIAR